MEELPAEISFHVPELYHKRIIGVGGRSIQRIMKRYGVYVKFLSGEEVRSGGVGVGAGNGGGLGLGGMSFGMSNGGVKAATVVGDRYTERDWEMEDNVVARTPAKNAANLEHLKVSVMELVAPKVRCPCIFSFFSPTLFRTRTLLPKPFPSHDGTTVLSWVIWAFISTISSKRPILASASLIRRADPMWW
jgi:hypothetical protein